MMKKTVGAEAGKPKLLDLFCRAGGTSMGYSTAGFDVVGVDIKFWKRYPFRMFVADALDFLDNADLSEFDVIAASPPCQKYSNLCYMAGTHGNHPDLIGPVRERLIALRKPYVIENIPGSPLVNPIMLCGRMFDGLRVYRHRLFESNIPLVAPRHRDHVVKCARVGRKPKEDEFIHVVGHFSGVEYAKKAMGIDWMTQNELREAIPPAYTEYIGKQLIEHLKGCDSGTRARTSGRRA